MQETEQQRAAEQRREGRRFGAVYVFEGELSWYEKRIERKVVCALNV